ncbi:hypothetical protein Desaci_4091 [Desulfosporosinus acidiphilus SJ4]|uniref:Uncharacterized protein n=1 Tax=Desulfosporosinus acidiphilus (strain DSM 22704 / JCM 16185 / SJ4) TaxID=646529 RepID=I4DAY0_DESAJ|nr:hypothetical protein Desaci_4091 [Desulfosporosinus acidiphilus SJ4]
MGGDEFPISLLPVSIVIFIAAVFFLYTVDPEQFRHYLSYFMGI